jgi:restriction endonuclease Mrr
MKEKITVKDIREIIGVVEVNNANKGVFCTTSDYTNASKKYLRRTNRIELLNGNEIIKLCNTHLESNWPVKIGVYAKKYQKIVFK